MEIKCLKPLSDYDYLVVFDLASKKTGVVLWDLNKSGPIETYKIETTPTGGLQVSQLYALIDSYFNDIISRYNINKQRLLVGKEAMPSQVHGGSSTIQTFIALSRSHGILDFYLDTNNIDVYDYTGIYPATTHAFLKKIRGWDAKHKIEKQDTIDYIQEVYSLKDLSSDEADAVFLAQTLIQSKWDKDIDEEIKEVKRHKKTLKLQKAIDLQDERIEQLNKLKINAINSVGG